MSFVLGVVLFALGIAISIALHEAGHLLTAKAFGMRVRRYFIGFGPKIFSFRRGETEYGLKAIPAGGFCDIAGMTALDEVTPEERPRAFFRKPTWQRVVVLSAGSITHFIIGVVLIFILAVTSGLMTSPTVVGQVADCVSNQDAQGNIAPCTPADPAPARAAGIQPGDRVLSVAGTPTTTSDEVRALLANAGGPVPVVVERDGRQVPLTVDIARTERLDPTTGKLVQTGALGVTFPTVEQFTPVTAIPATFSYTGTMFAGVWQGLMMFPEKIPRLIDAIGGAPRDLNTPVSVVGATVIGGDFAERGLWELFVMLLATLNFFVGVFNLLPLLPLDGGHIAVNLYERARDWTRAKLGKAKMPPVDYTKLLPITYAVILVGGAISLLTLTADIVNPIRLQ
ncbi:M50 family metallopeptidase [Pseudonocardia acidicola]|uniref:Site-2 protease family protein n=1 Tax=Pseudonocardia acidicola TaxID=2724939 RepID=A0ABX1S3E7_9PSEU|nr:site-2 protease family protein [Pseudonocardia acidicola]NMH96100.1 site-2 protease family protein [Pseudonocardia acidicola]